MRAKCASGNANDQQNTRCKQVTALGFFFHHAALICSKEKCLLARTADPTSFPSSMNFRLLPLFIIPLLLFACGGSETDTQTAPPKKEAANPKMKGKTPKRAYTAEELNAPYSTVSPWRYIVTSPETQYFERIVGKSSLARTVHSGGYALLVPDDATFTQNKDWKGILDEDQQEACDRFVRAHMIERIKGPKMLEGNYTDLNGKPVIIEQNERGELVCGGARLLGRELETDAGLVIPVSGMVAPIDWD